LSIRSVRIRVLEHTWGLPSVYDQIHWSNRQFQQVINTIESFNNCRSAWLEQREFFNIYLDSVRDHPVYELIEDELASAFDNIVRPDLDQFTMVSPTDVFSLFENSSNSFDVSFDENYGSISYLMRSKSIYWTDANSQLATFVYITYNETDFIELSKTYGNPGTFNKICLACAR
jgi:hypothetical protein